MVKHYTCKKVAHFKFEKSIELASAPIDSKGIKMSRKQEVIDFVTANVTGHDDVKAKILEVINLCDDNGILQKLATAYQSHNPSIEFKNDPNAETGAYYDNKNNKLVIKLEGGARERADMFLFESFNCFHRDDYNDLESVFKGNSYPPMFFFEYGRKKSNIEGKAVYGYVSLLREAQKNQTAYHFVEQARRALKKNDGVMSEDALMASMTWTPHDPSGTGDWQFTSPRHYAFQKAMDLTKMQASYRIRCLIVEAAVRDGSNYGSGKRKLQAYGGYIDQNSTFQRWWLNQWNGLRREQKPTAFISICLKANEVLINRTIDPWRPITLADYEFDTGMELEARRLSKRTPLTGQPT